MTHRLAPVVFVLYLFLSFSTLFSFIMILLGLKLPMAFLSSQGKEVNKILQAIQVLCPSKKEKKEEEKERKEKNKERVWGQTKMTQCKYFTAKQICQ